MYRWRYSETGQFVDFAERRVPRQLRRKRRRDGAGYPRRRAGARRTAGVGFEIRYQSAEGDLPADQGFAGSKIDLGGFNYLFVMNFRF